MNWLLVADWIMAHSCYERQKYHTCSCGKKKNPCQLAEQLANECDKLDRGEHGDVEAITKFIGQKRCFASRNGQECNHRGCIRAEELLSQLENQLVVA